MKSRTRNTKSTKFKIYRSFTGGILKKLLTHPKYKNKKISQWDAVAESRKFVPELLSPINATIITSEFYWQKHGKQALFLRDGDISMLLKGKYKINMLPETITPFPSFTLCLPKSFEVSGVKPSGILVSSFSGHKDYESTSNEVAKLIHETSPEETGNGIGEFKRSLVFVYYTPDGAYNVFSYVDEDLMRILQSENFESYSANQRDFDLSTALDMPLTEDDKRLQYTICKLVLSLSIYVKAKACAVRDGFPKVKRFALETPFCDNVKSHSLSTSFKRGSPEAHYRSWYIRQLSHEKYYQGLHAEESPGSRFVFVEDTIVNDNQTIVSIE